MNVFIVIGIITLSFLLLILPIKSIFGRMYLRTIKDDSLIVYGKKGHGKTLLFSEMSRLDKKDGYLSTTDFKHKGQEIITYDSINVEPNTWENVLNNDIIPIDKVDTWERKSVYLDDAGLFLPNYADNMLKKKYPSLPVAYALWRHLYDAPIHINAQAVDRVYKLLREQADGFVNCRGVIRFGPLAWIKCTYYSKIESAKSELAPMKKGLFNKYQKGQYEEFRATHGTIKDFYIFAPTWRNKYDSRYFHKVFFRKDWKTPKTKKCCKLKKCLHNLKYALLHKSKKKGKTAE